MVQALVVTSGMTVTATSGEWVVEVNRDVSLVSG